MNSISICIEATNLQKNGPRGSIYGPLDFQLSAGETLLFTGADGSGKTALLLTLSGRMLPSRHSQLRVLGYELPQNRRAVQRRAAVAGFAGLDSLDNSVSVAAAVQERMAWNAPWYRFVAKPNNEKTAQLLEAFFPAAQLPRGNQLIQDLSESQELLLRLALARLSDPALIVIDQIDQLRNPPDRSMVWEQIRLANQQGTTVVVSASDAAEAERATLPTLNHISLER